MAPCRDWAVQKPVPVGATGGALAAVDVAALHGDRWRRLAVAATKECRCSTVPPVDMALTWAHLTAAVGTGGAGGEAV